MTQSPILLLRLFAIAWCTGHPLAIGGCARHRPTVPAVLAFGNPVETDCLWPPLQPLEKRAQLGRHLHAEDLLGRSGDHDGARSGRSLTARWAGAPGLSGRPVHRIGAASVTRVRAPL